MIESVKKLEMQQLINDENGENYHRNINLNGYTVYRDKSFISFRILSVKNKPIVVIDYIYITNKKDLIQLLSWCINFWSGNSVRYIYYKEHKRKSNIIKSLSSLGFTVSETTCNKWKHQWKSTNGFSESAVIEAFTDRIDS